MNWCEFLRNALAAIGVVTVVGGIIGGIFYLLLLDNVTYTYENRHFWEKRK
jgi:hypothetical protein